MRTFITRYQKVLLDATVPSGLLGLAFALCYKTLPEDSEVRKGTLGLCLDFKAKVPPQSCFGSIYNPGYRTEDNEPDEHGALGKTAYYIQIYTEDRSLTSVVRTLVHEMGHLHHFEKLPYTQIHRRRIRRVSDDGLWSTHQREKYAIFYTEQMMGELEKVVKVEKGLWSKVPKYIDDPFVQLLRLHEPKLPEVTS